MPDATDFLTTISKVGRYLRTYCDQRFSAHGLTLARGRALLHLAQAPAGILQSDLTSMLEVEHPTAVRLFDGLAQAGLVERRAVRGDRRVREIVLTDAGRPLAEHVTAMIDGIAGNVAEGIDPADLGVAARVLDRVLVNIARLERENAPDIAEMSP